MNMNEVLKRYVFMWKNLLAGKYKCFWFRDLLFFLRVCNIYLQSTYVDENNIKQQTIIDIRRYISVFIFYFSKLTEDWRHEMIYRNIGISLEQVLWFFRRTTTSHKQVEPKAISRINVKVSSKIEFWWFTFWSDQSRYRKLRRQLQLKIMRFSPLNTDLDIIWLILINLWFSIGEPRSSICICHLTLNLTLWNCDRWHQYGLW